MCFEYLKGCFGARKKGRPFGLFLIDEPFTALWSGS